MMERSKLVLQLAGPLCVTDGAGVDRTPRLQKARAILAMLAVAPRHRRSRIWLQDHLWSDAAPARASAGLRYALWELRRDLGPFADAVTRGSGWIGLDTAQIDICLPQQGQEAEDQTDFAEFAEGLDVCDEEFDTWLRDQRLSNEGRVPCPPPVSGPNLGHSERTPPLAVLELRPVECHNDKLLLSGNMLLTSIATRVARNCGASVRVAGSDSAQNSEHCRHLRLNLRLSKNGKGRVAQFFAQDMKRDELVWSIVRPFQDNLIPLDPTDAFVNIASSQICHALTAPPLDASEAELEAAARCRALMHPSNFRVTDLARKNAELQGIEFPHLQGVAAARRALVLAWLVIERGVSCADAALEEAGSLSRLALESDPSNPEALAVASELADFWRKPDLALDFARRAVAIDPQNPIANASLAKALARCDAGAEAYRVAVRAEQLASGSANAAWWSMASSVAAVGCGDMAAAIRHANLASQLDPHFSAPFRFLSVLAYGLGDVPGSVQALKKLKDLEPDFTPEFLSEPGYPLRSFEHGLLKRVARAARAA